MFKLSRAALELLLLTGAFILAYYFGFLVTYNLLKITNGTIVKTAFAEVGNYCYEGENIFSVDKVSPFVNLLSPQKPEGSRMNSIFIKSGNRCFGPFNKTGIYENDSTGKNNCYSISGYNTDELKVVKTGTGIGELCPQISRVEVVWESQQVNSEIGRGGTADMEKNVLGASNLADTGTSENILLVIGTILLTVAVYGTSFKIIRNT